MRTKVELKYWHKCTANEKIKVHMHHFLAVIGVEIKGILRVPIGVQFSLLFENREQKRIEMGEICG